MKKYKLEEVLSISSISVIPQAGITYKLYSLPSFDDGQEPETARGEAIQSNKYVVPTHCILFNKLNVRFKRIWRIDNNTPNKLCSTEFLPLVINDDIIDYQYCYYLLASDYLTNYLCGINSNTSGSHKRINPDMLLSVDVVLPPLKEQKCIGSMLANLDRKIALNRALNHNLEAMAKQLYDYWFVQFDFPDKNGRPYKSSGGKMVWNEKLKREIPDGWKVANIRRVLDKVITTPRVSTAEYLLSGSYPVIDQTSDVYCAGFTERQDAVVNQYPAVVFGDHSCAVKYVNFPFARGADGTQVILSKEKNVSIEYLYYVVKDVKIRKGYARHFSFLKEHPIILPSETEAKKFQGTVQILFEQITRNRKENLSLTKLRDELLPLLMNGQVSVNYDLSND